MALNLENLKITNWSRDEYDGSASTSLAHGDTSGYLNSSWYINVNTLRRAVRLRISVQDEFADEGMITGGSYGYYAIGTNSISISGRYGTNTYTWALQNTYPSGIHPNNPLKGTEYAPGPDGTITSGVSMNNSINNISYSGLTPWEETPYAIPGGFIPSDEYGENSGNAIRPYKVFTQNDVVFNGDQNVVDWVNVEGTDALTPLDSTPEADSFGTLFEEFDAVATPGTFMNDDGSPMRWYNTSNGLIYTDPFHSAQNMWSDYVKKVVMFDTLGYDSDTGYPLQGNEIDIFVILKDTNDNMLAGTALSDAYGVTLASIGSQFSDTSWYEAGGSHIVVDFDGDAVFVDLHGHDDGVIWDGEVAEDAWGSASDDGLNTTNDPNADLIGGGLSFGGVGGGGPLGMPAYVNTEVDIDFVGDSGNRSNVATSIRRLGKWKIKENPYTHREIMDGAEPNEDRWNINGIARFGRYSQIAEVIVRADRKSDEVPSDNDYYFTEIPKLISANPFNFKMEIKDKTIVDNRVTSYTFRILHRKTSKLSGKKNNVSISYKVAVVPTAKPLSITSFTVTGGNRIKGLLPMIQSNGESRVVTIKGVPNSKYAVVINESGSSDPNERADITSIIKPNFTSNKVNYQGILTPVISGELDDSGVYSFRQTFPSTTIKRTKVNGTMASSGATKIIYDNLTGVEVGDRIYSSSIPSTTVVKVAAGGLNPDGDNVNECTLDTSVTLADNATVEFKRQRQYEVVLLAEDSSLGDRDDIRYFYHQFLDPVVTIRNTPSSDVAITHNNGIATSLAKNNPFDVLVTGKFGTGSIEKPAATLSMVLDIHTASHEWLTFSSPQFRDESTYWTNSKSAENGGTKWYWKNIKTTALGLNTVTLSYDLYISRYGINDVVIDLDLEKVYTIDTT